MQKKLLYERNDKDQRVFLACKLFIFFCKCLQWCPERDAKSESGHAERETLGTSLHFYIKKVTKNNEGGE